MGDTSETSNNKSKKSSFGLLSFMRNEGETSIGSVNIYKDKTDKALLQETLFELIECKRVLDRAR